MNFNLSMPLYSGSFSEYSGFDDIFNELAELGCNGVEGIWGGEDFPDDMPASLIGGYHLIYFADWYDFYMEDTDAVKRKFGSIAKAAEFYGGWGRECIERQFREDLNRACSLDVPYVVYHVSDVSVEEAYTYKWLHDDYSILTAAAEIINTVLSERDNWPFKLLIENQWWPGFTFTQPEKTEYILDAVKYKNKGIMLDFGHLMNTCPDIRSQAEGAGYIMKMIEKNGSLSSLISGIHLHQSVSGEYVKNHTGFLPENMPEDYFDSFSSVYGHVLQIDRHEPWSDAAVLEVIERIEPEFVTHELSARGRQARRSAVMTQNRLLKIGGLF